MWLVKQNFWVCLMCWFVLVKLVRCSPWDVSGLSGLGSSPPSSLPSACLLFSLVPRGFLLAGRYVQWTATWSALNLASKGWPLAFPCSGVGFGGWMGPPDPDLPSCYSLSLMYLFRVLVLAPFLALPLHIHLPSRFLPWLYIISSFRLLRQFSFPCYGLLSCVDPMLYNCHLSSICYWASQSPRVAPMYTVV